jgi:hypothetical protein
MLILKGKSWAGSVWEEIGRARNLKGSAGLGWDARGRDSYSGAGSGSGRADSVESWRLAGLGLGRPGLPRIMTRP